MIRCINSRNGVRRQQLYFRTQHFESQHPHTKLAGISPLPHLFFLFYLLVSVFCFYFILSFLFRQLPGGGDTFKRIKLNESRTISVILRSEPKPQHKVVSFFNTPFLSFVVSLFLFLFISLIQQRYVQLLNVAVIDWRVRKITYTQQTDSISAIIPHFWQSAGK